jgi:hypothetical protein
MDVKSVENASSFLNFFEAERLNLLSESIIF